MRKRGLKGFTIAGGDGDAANATVFTRNGKRLYVAALWHTYRNMTLSRVHVPATGGH